VRNDNNDRSTKDMQPTITIMHGLPGSGKSWHACRIASETGARIHSADAYPGLYPDRDENGRLRIDFTKLGPAHGASMKGAAEDVRAGKSVVIDATNLGVGEMAFYVGLAQAYGAAPIILRVDVDPETAFARNTHDVPFAVIRNSETGDVRKTYTFGDDETGEHETVVGGFVAMIAKWRAFQPEFHWQFLPGFEDRTV
jgi:predicted kinase